MKALIKDKFLISLWILTTVALIAFLGHFWGIIIDFGREVYYPAQILNGKVLYKDLFNIYGPFSYLFNAFLYKLFGANLSTLYTAGIICSFSIVTLVYVISKRFLSVFLSFSIGILTISVGIATTLIFNFSFPYSWAMLYGLVCFLISLYFLLKSEDRASLIYWSAFFAGVAASNKYEFLAFAFFVIIYAFFKSFKTGIKALSAFLIAPLVCYGFLWSKGLKIPVLLSSLKIVSDMAKSQTLRYFYQNVGVYYHEKTIPFLLTNFAKTAFGLGGILYGAFLYKKHKWVLPILSFFSFLLMLATKQVTFIFLPILLILFGAFSYKKLSINRPLLILVISAVLVSLKSFWGLIMISYGSYYIGIMLVAFFALLFSYLPKAYEKICGIYLLVLSAMFLHGNIQRLNDCNTKINNQYLYTQQTISKSTNELLTYIDKNTSADEEILILPEGMIINFFAKRKSDNYYNSLIPLYIEVLGEENIINHFQKTKPKYIILNNHMMHDYGLNFICYDYALGFCKFVEDNYYLEKIVSNKFNYVIYKLK